MIRLTLTEDQASLISAACEFYSRVRLGQFQEIVWHCSGMRGAENPEEAEAAWLALRKLIYPDLHGVGHSYGYGKFEDADKAFDVHQVIRHTLGDERTPFSYYDLPKCEKVEETK